MVLATSTAAEVDDAFRLLMRLHLFCERLPQALKDAQRLAALVAEAGDLIASGCADSDSVGKLESFLENIRVELSPIMQGNREPHKQSLQG